MGALDRDPAAARRDAVAAVNRTYNQDFEPLPTATCSPAPRSRSVGGSPNIATPAPRR
ncbi:hypothetical protein I553_5120 [Mycobacterium xenopi 4042]|uniref:Uncharacterized protein n=1 Tax=Mycobacterium xenopi 4042 TaxID=1299334 RepID=X7ZVX1_MYCXE|nr:hypothetical protein I553_5120 [Mycobacterium xenopi 4042]